MVQTGTGTPNVRFQVNGRVFHSFPRPQNWRFGLVGLRGIFLSGKGEIRVDPYPRWSRAAPFEHRLGPNFLFGWRTQMGFGMQAKDGRQLRQGLPFRDSRRERYFIPVGLCIAVPTEHLGDQSLSFWAHGPSPHPLTSCQGGQNGFQQGPKETRGMKGKERETTGQAFGNQRL